MFINKKILLTISLSVFAIFFSSVLYVFSVGTVNTGFRVNKNTAVTGVSVNAWSICQVVKNVSPVRDYFVPTGSASEWNAFLANAPASTNNDIVLGSCIQCSSGDCCDIATGNFKSGGTTCRASAGPCDVAETCTGVSSVCPTDSFRNNTYVCDACSAAGASGACQITDTGYRCSGTSAACGTTNPYTCPQNASVNNNVWTGSTWAAASYTNRCNLGSYTCSGNNVIRAYYGCNTSGTCNTTAAGNYTAATCTGGENSRCVAGQSTCQNLCSDGLDNDGDGDVDAADSDCGGCGQCNPTDACCDASGCFLSSGTTCRATAGTCDVEEKCTGVSGVCPTNTFRTNAYVCDDCSATGAAGSCQINDTGYKCTGSSATCGTTNPFTCPQNAPTNNNVWNSSSWATASYTNRCNLGSYTCSGNNVVRPYYGCNTSGSCNTTAAGNYTFASCTGGENSRCVAGQSTCQNLCSDGIDNDGDGSIDGTDPDCGGCGQCNPADACCDADGCFLSSATTCRASAGVCDVEEKCSGVSGTCPSNTYRNNSYVCDACSADGSAGACQINDTGYKCTGSSATCGTTNPYTCPQNAPTTNNVWTASNWAAASSSNYCNLGSYSCSGNSIVRSYYGCTTSGTCSTTVAGTYTTTTCTGGENSRCVNGQSTCQNYCSDGIDNDGDGKIDAADSDCGGCGQCNPSDPCCDSSGCFKTAGTVCRESAGVCDVADTCTGSSSTCTNDFRPNTYVCNSCSTSGSSGSCQLSGTGYRCTGSSATCGTTNPYSCTTNAPTTNNVWTGSSWVAASSTNRCNLGAYFCSGNTIKRYYYGCTTSGTCSTTAAGSYDIKVCSGAENQRCVNGQPDCVNLCSDGVDNDGDGYTDGQDSECGGCQQCTSGTCCNTANACFRSAGTGVGTCQKCTGSSANPVNQTSSEDILNQCSTGSAGSTTSCRSNNCSGTGAYCGYLSSSTTCRPSGGVCDIEEKCTGSAYTCPSNSYQNTSYPCATISSCSGANNSCNPTQTRQFCSGSSASCTGSQSSSSCTSATYPRVWYSGAWNSVSSTVKCGTATAHTCNGQQPQGYAKGCNAYGSCGYTSSTLVNVGAPCDGTEDHMCQGGACVNKCSNLNGGSYTGNDDGDSYVTDLSDPDCGGCGQCNPSDPCCDSRGCFLSTATKCYSRSCTGSYLSGTDNSCTYTASERYCSGTSGSCNGTVKNPATCNCPSGKQWNSSTSSCDSGTSTNYCGLSSSTSCSGTSVTKQKLWCGDTGDCTVPSGYYTTVSTCSGSTPYCSGGNCVACTSGSQCGTNYWDTSTCSCTWPTISCRQRIYTCNSGVCGSYLGSTQTANTCSPGYTCLGGGSYQCYVINCSSGYTLNSAGSGCTCCPAGYKCPSGDKEYCSGGTYQTSTCRSTCNECPAGSYCTGGTNRTSCPSGTSSNPGAYSSSQCFSTNCSPGYYWAETASCLPLHPVCWDSGECAPCPPGKYGGGTSCTCCAKGRYQDGYGSSTCKYCPSGWTTAGTCSTSSSQCNIWVGT